MNLVVVLLLLASICTVLAAPGQKSIWAAVALLLGGFGGIALAIAIMNARGM